MKYGRLFTKDRTAVKSNRSVALKLMEFAGLLLEWPLVLVSAIAVRLDSEGPILVDEGGLRFRTTSRDGKLTRIGRFLRKAELDCIPQRLKDMV